MMLVLLSTLISAWAIAKSTNEQPLFCERNVCLPWNYEQKVMPQNKPIEVDLKVFDVSVKSVVDADMSITIEFGIMAIWSDPRIGASTNETNNAYPMIPLGPDFIKQIWKPYLYLESNRKISFAFG